MTPKVTLQPLLPDEAENFSALANNPRIAAFLTNQFPHPYTLENALAFINKVNMDNPLHVLGIRVDGVLAGAIGVHPQSDVFCRNAELGYWLAEFYWGKGIMTEAVKLMVSYAFNHFEIDRLFARPFGNNIASQMVLKKCGFKLEAEFKGTILKNGEVLDELVFAIRREL